MTDDVISVGLADDQVLVRAGFAMVLQSQDDIDVRWEASDGAEAVKLARAAPVDVILMDVQMPELNGIDATRTLVDSGSGSRIVVLTTFDNDEYVIEAITAGASGFLLKDSDPEYLIAAVRTVGDATAVISPRSTARLLRQVREGLPNGHSSDAQEATGAHAAVPRLPDPLTDREVEILRLIALGRSNTEIADALFLSLSTVKTHVGRVLTKTGSRDRVHVVLWAFRNGVVRSDDLLN